MFVNRIELRFGIEMNPHLTIRNRVPFKSPVCRFVRLNFMNREFPVPMILERIWRDLRESSFVLFLTVWCDGLAIRQVTLNQSFPTSLTVWFYCHYRHDNINQQALKPCNARFMPCYSKDNDVRFNRHDNGCRHAVQNKDWRDHEQF